MIGAFYLKKDAVSCLHASNRWPERALRPPPGKVSTTDSIYFLSAHSDRVHRPARTQDDG
ncbi:Uncharacterised protein [Escherichia coli]|uniref:Uncharacterized protein n=1 Tax=Escherichia coli TaxID=562 RepID=A0A2X1PWR1_ECOLX|nr:Uncharacterised protein [Escherichia coli]